MQFARDADRFINKLTDAHAEHSRSFKEGVLSGALQPDKYKYDCGYLKGLEDAFEIAIDVVKNLDKDDDDEA